MTKKTVQRPTMNYKILCVDDEQIILDALDRLFRHVGYQYVLTAHSGELGLGILENNQDADVIIADEKMGNGMSGSQFLKESMIFCPDAIRIQLTAYSDSDILVEAVNEAKIFRHVRKPWNNKQLVQTVQEGLKQRLLKRRENQRLDKMTRAAKYYRAESVRLKKENQELASNLDQLQESIGQTASKTNQSFLDTLLFTMQYVNPTLWQHSRRVGKWCRLMADAVVKDGQSSMSFPPDILEMAGVLHDIGKLKFPESLWRIPVVDLSEDQKKQVSMHVEDGLWLIRRLPDEIRKILRKPIRQHHERRDGKGYYGIFLDQIDDWAQIIGIVSDYDNFRFSKLHGGPLGPLEVIEKMKEDIYSPSEQIGKYNERFFDIFENLSVNVSDEELERNESVELPSIQDVTSGQILAEDLYTVKDIFFLARNHMIESSDIEKMRIYEDEDNGVRNIWVQSSQE